MKITRIIALGIFAGTLGWSTAQAQNLRASGPPAEIPPASYTGKQYVDSRGCVYIRAGIDGSVNWVPRVARSRKQLCGFEPSRVAGTARASVSQETAPELITLPDAQRPAAAAPAPARAKKAAPQTLRQTPRRTTNVTSPSVQVRRPAAVVVPQKPRRNVVVAPQVKPRVAQPQPPQAKPRVVVKRVIRAPAPAAPSASNAGPCQGASAISQQYINASGARCGPQSEGPVSYGTGSGIGPQSYLAPNTRVVPAHVYQMRKQSADLRVPAGYQTVWADDRLNLRRAEGVLNPGPAPAGIGRKYQPAFATQDRYNTQRGQGRADGTAAMAQVWTETLPRKLVPVAVTGQTIKRRRTTRKVYEATPVASPQTYSISSRSAPAAAAVSQAVTAPRRYVRAATFSDTSKASLALQRLRATGLPVRMGRVNRNGQVYSVVLAGPFGESQAAGTALQRVKRAGFTGARLSK